MMQHDPRIERATGEQTRNEHEEKINHDGQQNNPNNRDKIQKIIDESEEYKKSKRRGPHSPPAPAFNKINAPPLQNVIDSQQDLINSYVRQVGQLMGHEATFKQERVGLLQRIGELEHEISRVNSKLWTQKKLNNDMSVELRQVQREILAWKGKYDEGQQEIEIYANMVKKLTEQNAKLKDWISMKKKLDEEAQEMQAVEVTQDQNGAFSPSTAF